MRITATTRQRLGQTRPARAHRLGGAWLAIGPLPLRIWGEDRVNEVGYECDLVVELGFADGLEVFLAPPCCPLRLTDSAVPVQMRTDGLKGDAAVLGDGFGRSS